MKVSVAVACCFGGALLHGQEAPAGKALEPGQESASEGGGEKRSGGQGMFGKGIRNVLGALGGGLGAGDATSATEQEAPDKGASEESQRRINEFVRVAHMNIEKGRVAEAYKNVSDLISLKPYEADFHLALGL